MTEEKIEEKKSEEKVEEKTSEENDKNRINQWMIRPCEMYEEELKECKCMGGRFQQYFVFGKYLDCSQWRIDYDNCRKWKKTDSDEAFDALLASEKKRRLERLKPHYCNDVWPKRDQPPENWNDPLPDWMIKKQYGTLLYFKQKALKSGEPVNDLDVKLPLCSIM